MYCENCGKQRNKDDMFCVECLPKISQDSEFCSDSTARFVSSFNDLGWQDENGVAIPKEELDDYFKSKQQEFRKNAMKKYMPIGSVIKLKDDFAFYMIIGFKQKNETEIYDYIGCPYPKGILGETKLFNHLEIERFYHIGYFHPMGEAYRDRLLENSENDDT